MQFLLCFQRRLAAPGFAPAPIACDPCRFTGKAAFLTVLIRVTTRRIGMGKFGNCPKPSTCHHFWSSATHPQHTPAIHLQVYVTKNKSPPQAHCVLTFEINTKNLILWPWHNVLNAVVLVEIPTLQDFFLIIFLKSELFF